MTVQRMEVNASAMNMQKRMGGCAGDVRDRVGGADLVKVDLLDSLSMDVGFRLGDQLINGYNIRFNLFRKV